MFAAAHEELDIRRDMPSNYRVRPTKLQVSRAS